MSTENITALFAKSESDPDLAAKITATKALPPPERIAALIQLGTDHGTPFTADDLKTFLSAEVSDADLADVSGGGYAQPQSAARERSRAWKDYFQDTAGSRDNITYS